jgi:hypothetical protein
VAVAQLVLVRFMFPRAAFVILGFLVGFIASIVVFGASAIRDDGCIHFQAGIAQPYENLLTHMRQLADAGRIEELREVITQAQSRSGAVSAFWRR